MRFLDARTASRPRTEILVHLNALKCYLQGLDLLPSDAIQDLAVNHGQLGIIYKTAGDFERALEHYRKSISYHETAGDVYSVARTRRNVALALSSSGRFADAKEYALAALRNFETYGASTAKDVRIRLS
jgi:tetratricopeptide (TPR) repeat protein